MMETKQVIVMRKFKGLRTGKYIAQACHASMAFLTKEGEMYPWETHGDYWIKCEHEPQFRNESESMAKHYNEIDHWLTNSFKKVVVYVNSEEELKELHQKALGSGLMSHLIEDNGATEFHGVKTLTCLAIGPHKSEKFEGLTDHLPLL
jgi:PTH2 family peptidyl-tRNA hydrolase